MTHRLQSGPCVWRAFEDLIGTRQGIHKALRKMNAAGLAEVIGEVNFHGEGGNAFVWAAPGRRHQRTQLKHDCIGMLAIVALGLPFLRGNEVDADLLPDFELFQGGRKLNGEIDSGASNYGRVIEERYPKYEGCSDPTLWISCGLYSTNDLTRMEGLRVRAKNLPDFWFSTLAAVRKSGLETFVVNVEGSHKRIHDLLTDREPSSTEE